MQPDKKKCASKNRKTGFPCQNWAMKNGRCRFHGGKMPEQTAFQPEVGVRSTQMLRTFGERCEALMNDPEMYRFEPELVTFDQAFSEALQLLPEGDGPGWRNDLLKKATECDKAVKKGDVPSFIKLWGELLVMIRAGTDRWKAFENLQTNRERRAALAEKALGVQQRAVQTVTIKDMVALIGQLVDLVNMELGEDNARKIARRFETTIFARPGTYGARAVEGSDGRDPGSAAAPARVGNGVHDPGLDQDAEGGLALGPAGSTIPPLQ